MTRDEADYLIDKSVDTILQAAAAEQAMRRRELWVWAAIVWAVAIAGFVLIVTANAAERLHDGAPCFNEWGEPGTYYGHHCYVDSDD